MRAFFLALALTIVPAGLVVHAQDSQPGDTPPAATPSPDKDKTPARAKPQEGRAPEGRSLVDRSGGDPEKAEADHAKRLDALFAALKAAPTKESAKAIADRIDVALLASDNNTADLLMTRAVTATEAKDYDLAIRLLDAVLTVAPDYLDAWSKRATVFYLKQDFADSLTDLRQVVAREPRHYGAWAGIAVIAKEVGDEKHALEATRRALAIYPQLDQMKDLEKELSLKVEGRPI